MRQFAIILLLVGLMTRSFSQSPLLWSRDFNTELQNYYSEFPTIKTNGNTIDVIGRKNTINGQRLVIVKYDMLGDTIYTKTYGNDSVFNNTIIDYKFDTSNHVYILHKEKLGFYKSKIVLQKYALNGNLVWVQQIQSFADTSYTPHSLGLVNDTCLFVTSYKEFDYPGPGDDVIFTVTSAQLYAYNSNGNQLWLRDFDPTSEINWFSYDKFIYNNTAFIFANNSFYSNLLAKIDINNNLTLNTNTGIQNGINDVQLSPDNNLILISGAKYRLSKADLNGNVLWSYYYGTFLPSNVSGDEVKAMVQDSLGNIFVTGRHYGQNYGGPNYTNADILTIKYDNNGSIIWENRYEFGGNNADIGNTILLKNGQVYVGGESQRLWQGTDYDYVILKIDTVSGASTGIYRFDGIANGDDAVSSMVVFDNGNVALTGLSYDGSNYDWTTQLLSDVVLSVQNNSSEYIIKVYPNPLTTGEILKIHGKELISYTISNIAGQIIQEGNFDSNEFHSIFLSNFSSGMYLLNLNTKDQNLTSKIILR